MARQQHRRGNNNRKGNNNNRSRNTNTNFTPKKERVEVKEITYNGPLSVGELAEKLNPGSRLRATVLGGGKTVLKAVGSIPGIRKVEIESEADGQVTFTAESADASDRRAEVSRALSQAGCTVLALAAGLKLPIAEAEAVTKSWPNFFTAIKPLGAEVQDVG